MKCSKGGFTAEFIMEMDTDDFIEAIEAAEELEAEIAEAMKKAAKG